MTRAQLIKLIHIAKNQLKLDDDTYRAFLMSRVKKDTCKKMLKHELEQVYDGMKEKGFTYTSHKKKYGKPAVKIASHRDDIKKIKAIWITMGKQGFIHDASDKALNAYVDRMTKSHTHGLGIKNIAWLNGDLACHVLESIKQWHLRVIVKQFLTVNGVSYSEKTKTISYQGSIVRGYADIASLYEYTINQKGAKR